ASEEDLRIADGGGEPNALHRPSDEVYQALQHGEEVPAAVVAGKRVDLVYHNHPDVAEERRVVDVGADQHGFQRFRCGQQDVGLSAQGLAPVSGGGIAVPDRATAAEPAALPFQP